MSNNIRALAAKSLTRVIKDGKAFTGAVDNASPANKSTNHKFEAQDNVLDRQERALFRELCYGTLRHYYLLTAIADQYLKKPFAKKDTDIYAVILLGLYQLMFMRTAQHATLDTTVAATNKLKKSWAKGVVNAVLRSFLRDHGSSHEDAQQITNNVKSTLKLNPHALASHPHWLFTAIEQQWPESHDEIIKYNNHSPPMSLRVNLSKLSRDDYLELLGAKDITASIHSDFPNSAITLESARDVFDLPRFEAGGVSVQDVGAQYAAQLLQLKPNQLVLDACAAPGGKAAHMLEICTDIELTALDIHQQRLDRVTDNLARIGKKAKLIAANAAEVDSWWDGNFFDRILLDAPCSGTGVISHHPDIKLLRRKSDIDKFRLQQMELLASLWHTLTPSGLLLYCTCSVMAAENHELIAAFIKNTHRAVEIPIHVNWGVSCIHGRQLLPNRGKNGGFYYALLSKSPKV